MKKTQKQGTARYAIAIVRYAGHMARLLFLSSMISRLVHTVVPWCSGYHICFTRRRSPVRSWPESIFFFLRVSYGNECHIAERVAGVPPARSKVRTGGLEPLPPGLVKYPKYFDKNRFFSRV